MASAGVVVTSVGAIAVFNGKPVPVVTAEGEEMVTLGDTSFGDGILLSTDSTLVLLGGCCISLGFEIGC